MRTKRGGVCVISDTQSGQRRARRLGFHPRLKTVRRHRRHDHLLVVVWPSLAATAEGSRQRDDSQQQGFRGSFDERVARLQGSASGGAQRAATDYTHTALCQTSTLRDGCRIHRGKSQNHQDSQRCICVLVLCGIGSTERLLGLQHRQSPHIFCQDKRPRAVPP